MNILDWVLICAGGFWMLRGLMRGAISQIMGVAGILTGFIVASYHYQPVGFFITSKFPSISGTAAGPLSFILLFLLTWFSIAVAGSWVVRVVRSAGLGFLDRLWGAMIGFGKALLFAIVTISFLTLFSFGGKSSLVAESTLAPRVREASQFLFKLAPVKVQEEFSRKQKEVQKLLTERTSALLNSFFGNGNDSKEKGERNKN
ncbi:MAG TPA: CvpA family protein [Deltaproteobacteria bacterium]|jgi:membrane protein required for colicin V production|nr:CvpA family protein [Deltaproteobacteria bacterium]